MKNYLFCWMLLSGAMHISFCLAQPVPETVMPEFVPANSMVAIAKIVSLKLTQPNNWLVTTEKTETVLSETTAGKIQIHLTTGRGGLWLEPGPDWIGKTVLFMGIKNRGMYYVDQTPSPLSPNALSFYIWEKDADADIRALKTFTAHFSLKATDLRNELIEAVTDDAVPNHLKSLAMQEISLKGENDKAIKELNNAQFLTWRDLPNLPLDIRLTADFYLMMNSSISYQADTERVDFLTNITTSREASKLQQLKAQRRLEDVQR